MRDCLETFEGNPMSTCLAPSVASVAEASDRCVDLDDCVAGAVDRESLEGESDVHGAVLVERGRLIVSASEPNRVFCPLDEEFGPNSVDL